MHAMSSFKHVMHQLHDERLKMMHSTSHLIHEKAFWGMILIAAAMVALFSLLILMGNDTAIEFQAYPYPIP